MTYLIRKLARGASIALLLLTPILGEAATLKLSMRRTTMDSFTWGYVAQALSSQESLVQGYLTGYNFGYSIQAQGDYVHFVFQFANGWDYGFYEHWRNLVVTALNSSPIDPGYRWEISLEGDIDPGSNPWNSVDWLDNVVVRDGNYLGSSTIGWVWADNWKPQGDFWAYSFEYANIAWMYVYGGGYYYANGAWFWTWPGYGWVWKFDGQGAWVTLGDI